MAVIQDYYNGPCHITVHDDYIIHAPAEIQKIIERVSQIVINEESRRYVKSRQGKEEPPA